MSLGTSKVIYESYEFFVIEYSVDVVGGHGFLLARMLTKYLTLRGALFNAKAVMREAAAELHEHG
jgi:hypothetical protein